MYVFRVKAQHDLPHFSPLLKTKCVRQVLADERFPPPRAGASLQPDCSMFEHDRLFGRGGVLAWRVHCRLLSSAMFKAFWLHRRGGPWLFDDSRVFSFSPTKPRPVWQQVCTDSCHLRFVLKGCLVGGQIRRSAARNRNCTTASHAIVTIYIHIYIYTYLYLSLSLYIYIYTCISYTHTYIPKGRL